MKTHSLISETDIFEKCPHDTRRLTEDTCFKDNTKTLEKNHTKYTFQNEGLHARHVGPGEPKGSALIRLYQITVAERRFLFSRDFLHQDAVRLGLRLSNKRGRTSCVMGWDVFTLRQSHLAKGNPAHKWFYCILLQTNRDFPLPGRNTRG